MPGRVPHAAPRLRPIQEPRPDDHRRHARFRDVRAVDAAAKAGLNYPHVFDGLGWRNAVAQLYRVHGIPQTYLLDSQLNIVAKGLRGRHWSVGCRNCSGPATRRPPKPSPCCIESKLRLRVQGSEASDPQPLPSAAHAAVVRYRALGSWQCRAGRRVSITRRTSCRLAKPARRRRRSCDRPRTSRWALEPRCDVRSTRARPSPAAPVWRQSPSFPP